jgi:ATP-dependent 26S proteasome regulatory subunit
LLQPGRFEEIIEIGLPNEQERVEILQIALGRLKKSEECSEKVGELGARMEGMSASDITGICQKAGIRALMDGRACVEVEDIRREIADERFRRAVTGSKQIDDKML